MLWWRYHSVLLMGTKRNGTKLGTRKLAVAAMLCALGVVFLYVGSIIEILDLTMVAIASLFVFFAVIEMGGSYPYLIYLVTAVLSLLLLPSKFAAGTYLLFGGIYPVLKNMFEKLHHVVAWVLKLSYFNTILSILLAASLYLFYVEDPDMGFNLLTYGLANVTFVLYDHATSLLVTMYLVKLRKRLRIERFFEK